MITKVVIIDLPSRDDNQYAYLASRLELQKKLNFNNIMFNSPYKHGTNIIDYSKRLDLYKKTKQEKEIVKIEKSKKYKDESIIKSFVNSEIPNWNIKFILSK